MKMNHLFTCLLGGIAMLPVAGLPSRAASFLTHPERYSITDLGPGSFSTIDTLDEAGNIKRGGRFSNQQGQRLNVTTTQEPLRGFSVTRPVSRSEVVNPDGSRQSLGSLGDTETAFYLAGTRARTINSQGAVVGMSNLEAFWWTIGTGIQPIPSRSQLTDFEDLNDSGVAVGSFGDARSFRRPIRYELGSDRVEFLPTLRSGRVIANGISNNGRIVGTSDFSQALRFTSTAAEDLNRFIDPAAGWRLEVANDVNDAGQIMGSGSFNGERRRFLLTPVDSPPPAEVPEPSLLLSLLAVAGLCGLKHRTQVT